ncbi:amidohydrolase family protein [Lunatibacter salilacus]|uniref:amidohydrolase family protein n=1 Tax=Lunatibacter salilacus TaxID=2483804 RepID=UPI00131CFF5B|nr:amidohydrolase family protein [Lunatibacter salilacus]
MSKFNYSYIISFFICLISVNLAHAQSDPSGQKRITDSYLITNVTLIPLPGKIIQKQNILIKDGQILSVGGKLPSSAEAFQIPGDSLFAYPGFIDMANKSGVRALSIPDKEADFDPSNPPDIQAGIHPHIDVLDLYNPSHSQIADWRKNGFTVAHKVPMGQGMLPGTTGLVVYGPPESNTIIRKDVARYAKFSTIGGMYPATNLGVMAKFRDLFENARLQSRHQVIFASNQGIKIPDSNIVLQSLIPVVEKNKTLFFEINSDLDARRAITIQREQGVSLILSGINEGGQLITTIKESGAGVVLSLNLPDENNQEFADDVQQTERTEQIEEINSAYIDKLKVAGEYEKAGIPFAFTAKHLGKDKFYDNIRLMLKNGLSNEAALAALTVNPAKMLGIENITGEIAPGKMANIILTTDTLFNDDSQVKYVIANGYVFEYPLKKPSKNGKEEGSYWEYDTETASGSATGFFEISYQSGTTTGSISYDDPQGKGKISSSLNDLKVSSNRIAFTFVVKTASEDLTIAVEGDVSDNSITGTMRIGDYESFPFNATKTAKPKQ